MNLLLDTHVALWALADGPSRLGPATVQALRNRRNLVAVSAASVWEVEIKRALGKLDAPSGFALACVDCGFEEFPITFDHAEAAAQLPLHHTDPFDRILIGQATIEGFHIVTADRAFASYGTDLLDPAS